MTDEEEEVLRLLLDECAISVSDVAQAYRALSKVAKVLECSDILKLEVAACMRLTVDLVKHHTVLVKMYKDNPVLDEAVQQVEDTTDRLITEML